jgi:ABC-type uncharacterized transport system auxiliary subunit
VFALTMLLALCGCDPQEQPAQVLSASPSDPSSEPPLRGGDSHPAAVSKAR